MVYGSQRGEQGWGISLYIQDGNLTEPDFEGRIRSIEGIESALFASDAPAAIWVPPGVASQALKEIGGLKGIADKGKYPVYEEEGRFRIRTNLLTMDDESFREYCRSIGADPDWFYDTPVPRTIVVNRVQDDIHSNPRNQVWIPFLQLTPGDSLEGEENIYLEDSGEFTFTTAVGFVTEIMPDIGDRYGNYQLCRFCPEANTPQGMGFNRDFLSQYEMYCFLEYLYSCRGIL